MLQFISKLYLLHERYFTHYLLKKLIYITFTKLKNKIIYNLILK